MPARPAASPHLHCSAALWGPGESRLAYCLAKVRTGIESTMCWSELPGVRKACLMSGDNGPGFDQRRGTGALVSAAGRVREATRDVGNGPCFTDCSWSRSTVRDNEMSRPRQSGRLIASALWFAGGTLRFLVAGRFRWRRLPVIVSLHPGQHHYRGPLWVYLPAVCQ